MLKDDEQLDKFSRKWMEKAGSTEPGEDFTEKVMLSVLALKPEPVRKKHTFAFVVLLIIPLIVIPAYYSLVNPVWNSYRIQFFQRISSLLWELVSIPRIFLERIQDSFLSPTLPVVFLAALSLLLLDLFIARSKVKT